MRSFVGFLRQYFLILIAGMACAGIIIADHAGFFVSPKTGDVSNFASHDDVTVTGIVDDIPSLRNNKTQFPLAASLVDGKPVTGALIISLFHADPELQRGDIVELRGRITKPKVPKNPGSFDYNLYLRRQGIYGSMYTNSAVISGHTAQPFLRRWADKMFFDITDSYYSTLPQQEASVLAPMVIGDASQLTDYIKSAYRDSGTTHLLVVSGMNVAYVILVIVFIFKVFNMPLKTAQLLTIPFIILYTLATGANPPVVRASIMAIMIVIAMSLERESEVYNAMAASVLVVIYINPQSIFTPSFLLSYGATAGILYFYRPIIKPFSRLPTIPLSIVEVAAVTISSQLAVSPIIAYTFNRISIAGIFCNLLVVPLAGIITITGIVHYGVFKIAPVLLPLSTFVNYWLVHIQNAIVIFFAGLPHSSIRVPTPSPLTLTGYYIALWGIFHSKVRIRWIAGSLGMMLAAFGLLGNHLPMAKQQQAVEIAALRLGSADAMVLSMPNGTYWLIDAGLGGRMAKEDAVSEYLWHKGIAGLDTVIVTGTGHDRTGGLLKVIDNFSPRRAILPNGIKIDTNGKTKIVRPAAYYEIGEDSITVKIWQVTEVSGKRERTSLTTSITTPQGSMLFCGDISKRAQKGLAVLAASGLKCDIMTLPAHGKVALDDDFLLSVQPTLVIASTGKKKLPIAAGYRIISTNNAAQHVLMQGTTIQVEELKD